MTENPKRYLDKRELASLLGLSVYTIDAWVSQKREIPVQYMGSRVKFDILDVNAWLEKNNVYPEEE